MTLVVVNNLLKLYDSGKAIEGMLQRMHSA